MPDATALPAGLRFISTGTLSQLYAFPPDMEQVQSQANTLNNQVLVNTFEKEWADYTR
jgi:spermidine synthase